MNTAITEKYKLWLDNVKDEALLSELNAIRNDETLIEDAFYRDLEFGTAGLRGVIGAGTNRMNIYTVARASQGLASYVKSNYPESMHKIAIAYDSRINGVLFAQTAAGVFAANGIQAYIYKVLEPTPCLSYAVRKLGCASGIVVTASHNPAKYNGYKVYGPDGCQITTIASETILKLIESTDIFGVKVMDFNKGLNSGIIGYIDDSVMDSFIADVKKLSLLGKNDKADKNVSIVYTPLNGTGLVPVTRILKESGFSDIIVVKEQEMPDGNFPTCPYPNPEIREALEKGIEYAIKYNADLLLATDPDADRVGIAVKDKSNNLVLVTGNEVGMLLIDYICGRKIANGTMPENPIMVKTIVTTDLAERIAASYGVKTINVLTGFKYIGEQIGLLESQGKADSYLLGFEESYGYLSGSHVRDKDAVNASFLICEMFAFYKAQGVSLLDRLNEIYKKFGYCLNKGHSYEFGGSAGMAKMAEIMAELRKNGSKYIKGEIEKFLDYGKGIDNLPKAEVLKYFIKGNCSIVVRPSGTEPKIKLYVSVSAPSKEEAEAKEKEFTSEMEKILKA